MAPTTEPMAAPFQAPEPPPAIAPMAEPAAAPAPAPYTTPLVVRLCCSHAAQLLSIAAQATTYSGVSLYRRVTSNPHLARTNLISYVTCRETVTSTSLASIGCGAASAIATIPPRAKASG